MILRSRLGRPSFLGWLWRATPRTMGADKNPLPRATIEWIVSFLGLDYGGDLGGWTIYRNKHGKPVFYPRAVPGKPPSPNQQHCRARFKAAQINWMATPKATRIQWETFSKRLSLCMTGQNLYISLSLADRSSFFPAAMRKAKMSLTYPPLIPR